MHGNDVQILTSHAHSEILGGRFTKQFKGGGSLGGGGRAV